MTEQTLTHNYLTGVDLAIAMRLAAELDTPSWASCAAPGTPSPRPPPPSSPPVHHDRAWAVGTQLLHMSAGLCQALPATQSSPSQGNPVSDTSTDSTEPKIPLRDLLFYSTMIDALVGHGEKLLTAAHNGTMTTALVDDFTNISERITAVSKWVLSAQQLAEDHHNDTGYPQETAFRTKPLSTQSRASS